MFCELRRMRGAWVIRVHQLAAATLSAHRRGPAINFKRSSLALGPQLKAGLLLVLQEVADVDRQPLQFFVERLTRAESERDRRARDVVVVALQSLRDDA